MDGSTTNNLQNAWVENILNQNINQTSRGKKSGLTRQFIKTQTKMCRDLMLPLWINGEDRIRFKPNQTQVQSKEVKIIKLSKCYFFFEISYINSPV